MSGVCVATRTRLLLAAAAVVGLACAFVQVQAADAASGPRAPVKTRSCRTAGVQVLRIRTIPALAGIRFDLSGRPFSSDRKGIAEIGVSQCGTYALTVFPPRAPSPGTRARFSRWADNSFEPTRTIEITRNREIQVGLDVDYLVTETFDDLSGRPVENDRISRVVQTNSLGSRVSFPPGKPQWLAGTRIMRRSNGLQATEILWSVREVFISGTSVVRRAQQRFYPSRTRHFTIRLLLYSAKINAKDRLFNFPVGSGIVLTYPDGHERFYKFGPGAEVSLERLPRGTYDVTVKAPGMKSTVPIALTRDQVVALKVVTYVDLVVFFGLLSITAVTLVLVRRPRLRRRIRRLGLRVALPALALAIVLIGASKAVAAGSPASTRSPVPTLAYYYIWFDPGSWNRAKTDYPLLGRYSSDDVEVMRKHISWAKSAGIDGFIVSWKSTPVLNRRLAKLVRVASKENFKLSIIYQGLDFEREPLPTGRIAHDLRHFLNRYAHEPVFYIFGKPLVIWSGTWQFSRAEIAEVSRGLRRHLLLLSSEKSADDYERLADLVDGDAYYWGAVNPSTYPGYPEKLAAMSAAVHGHGGLWIAPAAPGFDARLVGGASYVHRNDGATLRREYDAAISSTPDAVGLISWNEFSENTHVEPSREYGTQYLEALADLVGAKFEVKGDFDSSESTDAPNRYYGYTLPLLIGFGFVLVMAGAAILWRRQIRKVSEGRL